MIGPMIRGSFAPTRDTSPPDQRESENRSIMIGRFAAPAAVGEYPCTRIRLNGTKNRLPPRAAYKKNVNKFAPLNVRERNRLSGIIGQRLRASTRRNSTSATTPTARLASTSELLKPRPSDSISP